MNTSEQTKNKEADASYRITDWQKLYEPPARESKGTGPLRFVKLRIFAPRIGPGFADLLASDPESGMGAFGFVAKMLELAGSRSRGERDGRLLDHRGRPADPAYLARICLLPLAVAEKYIELLLRVGWVEGLNSKMQPRRHEDTKNPLCVPSCRADAGGEENPAPDTLELKPGTRNPEPDFYPGTEHGMGRQILADEFICFLAKCNGNDELFVKKLVMLIAQTCRMDGADYNEQRISLEAQARKLTGRPDRNELGARFVELAVKKRKVKGIKKPWALWQRATDELLNRQVPTDRQVPGKDEK